MITLHHLERSRSMRILWALEELELDYQLKYYRRLANQSAPPELKKIHPLGKAPILTDDEKVIAESAVILDYLQDHYDQKQQFKPLTGEPLIQYHYWMHYAEGSLMPLLVLNLIIDQLGGKKIPALVRPLTQQIANLIKSKTSEPRLQDHIQMIEQHLAQQDYFVGENFSFADIQLLMPLQGLLESESQQSLPHIQAFVKRVTAREGYQRAIAKSPDGGKLF